MAQLPDQRRTLPPELRQCIYSYLLFGDGDGDGAVRIGQKYNTRDWRLSYEKWLPAVLALPDDPIHVAYRRRNPDQTWPDVLEEAFFRGV